MKALKRIISEAVAGNPIGLKEALAEELSARIGVALESKIDEEAHGVYLKGGSIGSNPNPKPFKVHDTKEAAVAHAKSLNKQLSPGEKNYYRMKFHVKPIKEDSDQLDEILDTPAAVKSYKDKATASLDKAIDAASTYDPKLTPGKINKLSKTADKRLYGLSHPKLK